ncbi:UNVERIFIED_CONTAM: hypothetical protein Slati_1104200 [Sesamum latifolium]|uniref:Uncharacterized protein n=1 Tax=Sesamum latifolium TaxID=2727402 RepID=A0AAW2XE17_9LAMI
MSSFLAQTTSCSANISGMSIGTAPLLQPPGLQGGPRLPAIRAKNVLPLFCLGLPPRSQGLVPLPFLPAVLPATFLPHLLLLLGT